MPSPKSSAKAERLLNLVIALLNAERFRDVAWIRSKVDGYGAATSEEAFFRMFERDKTELRDLGIPLLTSADGGYRIPRGEFALPDMSFTPGERVALGLAGRLWETSVLGEAGSGALRKLADASGDQLDVSRLSLQPRVRTSDPAFEPLYAAIRDRSPVAFAYRKGNTADTEQRHLDPWGLVSWRGRWYVVGHDTDRGEPRTFRLSRIAGAIQVGRAGHVRVPPGVNLLAAVEGSERRSSSQPRRAVLRLRPGTGAGLRRRAQVLASTDGDDRVEIRADFLWDSARLIAALGADAVVESPADLRDAVIRLLTGAAGADPAEQTQPRLDEVSS